MLLFILWSDTCNNIYFNSSGFSQSHTGITTLSVFGLLLHRGWGGGGGYCPGGGGDILWEISRSCPGYITRQLDSVSEIISFLGSLRNNYWVMGGGMNPWFQIFWASIPWFQIFGASIPWFQIFGASIPWFLISDLFAPFPHFQEQLLCSTFSIW